MGLGTHKAPSGNEAVDNSWERELNKQIGQEAMDHHVLPLSFIRLHSIEREVHKLKDVGKEDPLFLDDNSIEASNLEFQTQATLEEMLKQRIQVEVQYIAISSEAIQHSNYIHQIIQLMVQQKKLALQHMEVMKKLETKAHKLKLTCQEILEREQVLELQNRVSRLASCFTIQLILFLLVVYLFSSHPRKLLLVPT